MLFRSSTAVAVVLLASCFGCAATAGRSFTLAPDGRASRDGRPCFPVGIYAGIEARWVDSDPDKVRRLVEDLADSPFDFVINYGSTDGTIAQQQKLFALLAERGVRDVASVKDLYPDLALSPKGPFAGRDQDQIVREAVAAHRESPAIVGWYTSDEPEGDAGPIRAQHDRVKSLDPRRPTLMVSHQSKPEQLRDWVGTADILAVDPYPIPKRPVTAAADVVRTMKDLAGEKPVWFVLQAFGGYQYEESIRDRAVTPSVDLVAKKRGPTHRELRCLAYSAIAEGADGIVFYYHKDLIEGVDAERAWPVAKRLAAELRAQSPTLVGPVADVQAKKSSDDVRLIARRPAGDDGGRLSLIVANTSAATQTCVVTLPTGDEAANVRLRVGDCFYFLNGRELLMILDGLESVVLDVDSTGRRGQR